MSLSERIWACHSLLHLMGDEEHRTWLVRARLVARVAPLLVDQQLSVREAAANLLRYNYSMFCLPYNIREVGVFFLCVCFSVYFWTQVFSANKRTTFVIPALDFCLLGVWSLHYIAITTHVCKTRPSCAVWDYFTAV